MATRMIDLRAATLQDCDALAAIHGEAWLGAYRGLLDAVELQRLISRRNPDWWKGALQRSVQIKLLEISDTPAGYATYGTSRLRSVPSEGEIYELYLRPEYQGIGLGYQLFHEARRMLKSLGCNGMVVWCLEDSEIAANFFRSNGGVDAVEGVEDFDDVHLKKLGFIWN